MAPEPSPFCFFCADHGKLMESVGAIKANQETMGNDIGEIKAAMKVLVSNNTSSRIRMAEVATKVKVIYGGLGALAMLILAAAKDICMKKFFSP
jgi:hypothetical protein